MAVSWHPPGLPGFLAHLPGRTHRKAACCGERQIAQKPQRGRSPVTTISDNTVGHPTRRSTRKAHYLNVPRAASDHGAPKTTGDTDSQQTGQNRTGHDRIQDDLPRFMDERGTARGAADVPCFGASPSWRRVQQEAREEAGPVLPQDSLPQASLPEASLPEATLPEAAVPEAALPTAPWRKPRLLLQRVLAQALLRLQWGLHLRQTRLVQVLHHQWRTLVLLVASQTLLG